MSIAEALSSYSRIGSSRFRPSLQHFIVLLFFGPFVATTTATSTTPTCDQHVHNGRRAFCQALTSLELATPYTDSRGNGGGGEDQDLSFKWGRSRYEDEGGPNLHCYAADPSLELEILFRAYSRMHVNCNSLDRSQLSTKSTESQVRCKYLVWSCTFGLGNQLLSLVSAFLLSILSQRVLLLDNPAWDQLFSEPFEGSSWLAPPGLSFKDVQTPTTADYTALRCDDDSLRARSLVDKRCETNAVSVVFSLNPSMEDQRLLVCPSSILALQNITFLNLRNSNQHFALGFYFNPALRPLLELLFPERNVFHALSRFLLIPSETVYNKIRSHDQLILNASRRIGVQLRESKGDYRHYFDDAVPLCIKKKMKPCPIQAEEDDLPPSAEFVSIYVSSLVGGHFTKLQERIPQLEAETRQQYILFAQPADGEQIDDVAHQQKALVDIWMLSLSDIMLTTHLSTFGYTAHALAGITPFHLKHWPDNPCQLSLSNDPCYHFPPKQVTCPRDDFDLQDPLVEVPHIKVCPDIEETGLQLQEL